MPGKKPLVQVAPPLVEVAQPMFDEPPPNTRPTWNVDTIVLPNWKVSGSTSVGCWACASVYGSVLTTVTGTFAYAVVDVSSTAAVAAQALTKPVRVIWPRRRISVY